MSVCFQLVAFVREHVQHIILLMGYSMRFELNLIRSLNVLFFSVGLLVLYRGYSPLFLECVYFILLFPLCYLICFFRRVCV